LELFVVRHCVFSLAGLTSAPSTARHVLVSVGLFCASAAFAVATSNLGLVLELTGGFSASVLGFVMPAALYFRVNNTPVLFWREAKPAREVLPVMFIFGFGVVTFFASTSQAIANAIK
jgi:sodium-coupled neutral amino acid transporter 11